MKILIIDNYDSFTFNLYQYIAEISDTKPQVFYNDKITYKQIVKIHPDAIIISPGPGHPANQRDFGVSSEIIKRAMVPILGVCLGHQGIVALSREHIIEAAEIMHGRASEIHHSGKELFVNIPQGFKAIRYHSLVINPDTLPDDIEVTAWTKDNSIMGIKNIKKPLYGVQFHPESIGTEYGKQLLQNFLALAKSYESHI